MIPIRSRHLPGRALVAGFIAVAIVLASLAVACSSGSKQEVRPATTTSTPRAKATATEAPTLPPTATLAPEPSATAEPPTAGPTDPPATDPTASSPPPVDTNSVEVSPTVIGQGETTLVRLGGQSAASALAIADERRYPLIAQDGYYWGIVAAAGDAWAGDHDVIVELFDGNGDLVSELTAQVTVVEMGYPTENIDLPPEVNASLDAAAVQQEANARAAVFAEFTAQKLWSGPFIWPVAQDIVSPYGIRRSYNGGPVSSFHGGIDLAADEGVPVAASNAGRVAYVGLGPVHGNEVLVDHGDGVFSGYNHLSSVNVQVGQMVSTGDLVGYIGSTGMATGPHLHWEILVRGLAVDPVPWTLQSMGP